MEIGEFYRVKPAFCTGMDMNGKTMKGKVVYVHPKGRYSTLAFEGVHGTARECFFPDQLTQRCRK